MTFRYPFSIARVCILFAIALPAAAPAQNLLVNGDFAQDLNGWQFPDATPVWSSFDVNGAAGSGSAFGTNAAVGAGVRLTVLQQCVPIANAKAGLYLFSASAFTPSGQVAGNMVAGYIARATPDCSGGAFNAGGFYLPSIGQWLAYTSGTALRISAPPPPNLSIQILLSVEKTPAGGNFSGYFDAVYLIYDPIFADGFE